MHWIMDFPLNADPGEAKATHSKPMGFLMPSIGGSGVQCIGPIKAL